MDLHQTGIISFVRGAEQVKANPGIAEWRRANP
jgi:hypothetical protein